LRRLITSFYGIIPTKKDCLRSRQKRFMNDKKQILILGGGFGDESQSVLAATRTV
jgi:hypothetical protein